MTRQRAAVLCELARSEDAPSVEKMHLRLRAEMPALSRQTVRRTLGALERFGIIHELKVPLVPADRAPVGWLPRGNRGCGAEAEGSASLGSVSSESGEAVMPSVLRPKMAPREGPVILTDGKILPLKEAMRNWEQRLILDGLKANGGSRKETAKQLKINRTTLYNKMRKYGISEA